ncbi:feline leukemia virus subgroup C receptor-related protein 2-like [Coccinella septempunctata]|uniref:feline leukemia virus subgroup C receptor-related protein 2-like n=1 Tax=Coccinella septempunctata TaxID=41139 RepID=UPI001D082069|nr:feline leukemia virus subgroup C receptor-related protein 2-like [Coccinella septempunctata]
MDGSGEIGSSGCQKKSGIELDSYRWVIIAIFAAYCGTNFFLFMQFTIIANITERYYNVNSFLADSTGLVFMGCYIVFFIPVGHFIEKNNLKQTAVISTALTAFGNFLKLFAVSPDKFHLIIISQAICGIGQVFMISIPSKVACTWFGAEEVSIACAIGVMGCQIGLALGCIVPTLLVPDSTNMEEVAEGFSDVFGVDNVVSITMLILVILFFRSKPECPPSHSQASRLKGDQEMGYSEAFKSLMQNRDYKLILITFGMSFAVWNCLGIIVNEMFLHYYPADGKYLGILVLSGIIAGGIFGTILFGYILDKTHAFKKVSNVVLILTLVAWVCLVVSFHVGSLLMTSLTIPVSGFFFGSIMVIAFEYATEMTYPVSEAFSASLLNAAIYVFAIIDVLVVECIFKTVGFTAGQTVLGIFLSIAAACSFLISTDYKRVDANLLNDIKSNYGSVVDKLP